MRLALSFALSGLASAAVLPAMAADMTITVEIPQLSVAEYHRPYMAIWIEGADNAVAANLAVFYDVKLKNNEGTKWLKDMRQWWRKSGRSLTMPADGLSGATRAPGTHNLTFDAKNSPLGSLPPGDYKLVVEAAREVGGRELLRLPFQWPPQTESSKKTTGEHELSAIGITVKP